MRAIQDEFSALAISRQQKWQLRKQKAKKCIICGAGRINKYHCAKHAAAASRYAIRRAVRDSGKWKARRVVQLAILSRKLKRGRCHCGKLGEAHHADYSKPLKITWLCPRHHREAHGINGNNPATREREREEARKRWAILYKAGKTWIQKQKKLNGCRN